MHSFRPAWRAAGAAALVLSLAAGCATPSAPAPLPETPRDVRIVEVSDEVASQIADLVAAKLSAGQPAVLRPIAVQPAVPGNAPGASRAAPRALPEPVVPKIADVDAPRRAADAHDAVDRALAWLAAHQAPDGSWQPAGFPERCGSDRCDGPGSALYAPGVTGLALLAFVGNGETHQGGTYGEVVKKGLAYLTTIQDSEGCFGPRTSQHFMYNHLCASLAMTEAYGLTRSALFRERAQRAVDFVLRAQNPYLGWRYGVRDGDNDTSVTGWAVAVLASARQAGLAVDDGAFRGALSWIEKMTEPEFGRVGYNRRGGPPARTMEATERFPADRSEAMTASGLLTRLLCGESKDSEFVRKGAELLSRRPPVWDAQAGTNDFVYWYLGSLALRRVGGAPWDTWSRHLHATLVPSQVRARDDHAYGSWDPQDAWSKEGGRVYATALLCLAAETIAAK